MDYVYVAEGITKEAESDEDYVDDPNAAVEDALTKDALDEASVMSSLDQEDVDGVVTESLTQTTISKRCWRSTPRLTTKS